MKNKLKSLLFLLLSIVSVSGFTNSAIDKSFDCKKSSDINGSTEIETSSLRINYYKELDSKLEKAKTFILNNFGKKNEISEAMLLNYMKMIFCMLDHDGVLDYFEDLQDINEKFQSKPNNLKKYQAAFNKLTAREQELIKIKFEIIKDMKKKADF